MNDLQLSELTHDLVFTKGDVTLINKKAEVTKQALKINLLHYKGEWFLDNTYGVPYFQSILGKISSTVLPDAIFRTKTEESYNIQSVEVVRSDLSSDRVYTLDAIEATTTDGEIISITNLTI